MSRREASGVSGGLEIREDGATVTVAPAETDLFSVGGCSSSRGGGAADNRGETGTTPGEVSVEQGCPGGCRSTAVAGVVTAAPASAGHSEGCPSEVGDRESSAEGTAPPPSASLPASPAAVPLTSSLPDRYCEESTVTDDNQPPLIGDGNSKESSGGRGRNSKGSSGSTVVADRRRLPEQGPLTLESLSGVELVCGDIFREAW